MDTDEREQAEADYHDALDATLRECRMFIGEHYLPWDQMRPDAARRGVQ